jgi:Ca2+ transporting ATPase
MVRYLNSDMKMVTSGRKKNYDGIEKLYYEVEKLFSKAPSRHFTYVFNIFVMLQLFNFLNARKL